MTEKASYHVKPGVGRPRKTETVKQRQVVIYVPTLSQVEEWKRLARECGQSLSSWAQERIEDSMQKNGLGERYSRLDLIERNSELEKENWTLKRELEVKGRAYEALDHELTILRTRPFQNPVFQGDRHFQQNLILMFKKQKTVLYDDLLRFMGIRPTDIDAIKMLKDQIEGLKEYGLVVEDMKGWRWVA